MAFQTQEKSTTGFFIPAPLRWIALGAAVLSMGIAMPSCPGQQEMQQRIDALQNSQNEMTRKMQAMDGQMRTMSQEIAAQKQTMEQFASTIQQQMAAMGQLNTSLQQLSQQVGAMSSKGAARGRKSAPAPRRKGR